MEYYEEEFLEFEQFAESTNLRSLSPKKPEESHSDFLLDKFSKYEKWMKADRRKEWTKYMKSLNKNARKLAKKENKAQKNVQVIT